ncbi:hypothetical protein GEMRC1_012195 [Eukaryota sp. GEM-RC1]
MTVDTGPLHLECSGLTDMAPIIPQLSVLPNLTYLHLYQNRFKSLPEDMSALQHLETLDLSNNKFPSADDVIHGLQSLPSLKHLFIRFENPSDEEVVALQLDNLISLNGIWLDDSIPPEHQVIPTSHSPYTTPPSDDLESSPPDVLPLALASPKVPSSICESLLSSPHVLASLNDDTDTSIAKLYEEYLHSLSTPSPCLSDLSSSLSKLIHFGQIFADKYSNPQSQSETDLFNLCQLLLGAAQYHFQSFDTIQNYIDSLKTLIKEKEGEASRLQSNITDYYDESQDPEGVNRKLMEDVGFLQQENERLLNRLAKLELSGYKDHEAKRPERRDGLKSHNHSPSVSEQKRHPKTLSLKQLVETIDEIYTSKVKFDEKCRDQGVARGNHEAVPAYVFHSQIRSKITNS